MHTDTATEVIPAWAVRRGDVLRAPSGHLWRVVDVDTDVARHGGYVALYWMPGPEGRVLHLPHDRVQRVRRDAK